MYHVFTYVIGCHLCPFTHILSLTLSYVYTSPNSCKCMCVSRVTNSQISIAGCVLISCEDVCC